MMRALKKWWNKPADEVADALDAAFECGRRIEREECARVADKWMAHSISAEIRERSNTKLGADKKGEVK